MSLSEEQLRVFKDIFEKAINDIYGGIYYSIFCMRLKLSTTNESSPPYLMIKKPKTFYKLLINNFANGLEFMAKAFLKTFFMYLKEKDPSLDIPSISTVIDALRNNKTDVIKDIVTKIVNSPKLRRECRRLS